MSIGDFKRYFEDRKFKKIYAQCIFDGGAAQIKYNANSMLICCNPKVVCLVSGENAFQFGPVDDVEVRELSPCISYIELGCSSGKYLLVAEK